MHMQCSLCWLGQNSHYNSHGSLCLKLTYFCICFQKIQCTYRWDKSTHIPLLTHEAGLKSHIECIVNWLGQNSRHNWHGKLR